MPRFKHTFNLRVSGTQNILCQITSRYNLILIIAKKWELYLRVISRADHTGDVVLGTVGGFPSRAWRTANAIQPRKIELRRRNADRRNFGLSTVRWCPNAENIRAWFSISHWNR